MQAGDLHIRPLTQENARDFFAFFEGDAFTDNPTWAACYCNFVHFNHAAGGWKLERPDFNKSQSADRIARGRMHGHLAYDGATPVGWVNAAPSADYPPGNFTAADADPATLGNILCFVVAPNWRRKGVARLLLDAACEGLRQRGMTLAQANPRADVTSAAANHFGPLAMFLSAGFTIHSRDEADGSLYVRRSLR